MVQETASFWIFGSASSYFEHTELFSRGIGDTTDVVENRCTLFSKKGTGDYLRPEATASWCAHILNTGWDDGSAGEMWCAGRCSGTTPQGTVQTVWQVDFESIGASLPMPSRDYRHLPGTPSGGWASSPEVVINSVGCPGAAPTIGKRLTDYFESSKDKSLRDVVSGASKGPPAHIDCKRRRVQSGH